MGGHISVKRGKLESLKHYKALIFEDNHGHDVSLLHPYLHAYKVHLSMMKLFLCLENLISLNPIYWLSRINSCGWVRFIAPEGSQHDIFRSSLLSFEHFWFLTRRVGEICTLSMAVCYWTDRYIHILIFSFRHLDCTSYHSKHKQWMDWIVSVLQIRGSRFKFSATLLGWTIGKKGTSFSTTTVKILKCEKLIFKKWNWCAAYRHWPLFHFNIRDSCSCSGY